VPSFADQVDDGPALLATLQAFQGKFGKFVAPEPATEQDGQNISIPFSSKSSGVGRLPECRSLSRRKPVTPTRAQFADTFDAMNPGCQFGAQQTSVGCFVSQPAHGCKSDVDSSRSKAALL